MRVVSGCVTVDFLPLGRGKSAPGLLQLFQLTIWQSCHPIDLAKRLSRVDSD